MHSLSIPTIPTIPTHYAVMFRNLDNHVNRIHLLIRPFICEKCGLGYGCAGELDVHMARHGEEKRHKCNQCDYASHVKADYQSRYPASYCIRDHVLCMILIEERFIYTVIVKLLS